MRRVVTLLLLCCLALFGCGGSDSGTSTVQAAPQFSIFWPDQARTVTAPSSAESVRVTFAADRAALPNYIVNRPGGAEAQLVSYTSPTKIAIGNVVATFTFFAQPNGEGSVVGRAVDEFTLALDGSGMGNVTVEGTVAIVTVSSGQAVSVGEATDLSVAVQTASGDTLVVDSKTVFWAVTSGSANLRFDANGKATGLASGTATVVATVDGKSSAPQTITVTAQPKVELIPFPAEGAGAMFGNAISGDGKTIVGTYNGSIALPFVWRDGQGTTLIQAPAGHEVGGAVDITPDGSWVVGMFSKNNLSQREAFRWSQSTGVEILAMPLGFSQPNLYSISDDGTTIVGSATDMETGMETALVWRESTGFRPWLQGRATSVTANGSLVFGLMTIQGQSVAFRAPDPSHVSPLSAQGGLTLTSALACTPGGGVVVGAVASPGFTMPGAYIATSGVISLYGIGGTSGRAVTNDGSRIFGGGVNPNQAFVWDGTHGFRRILDSLTLFDTATSDDLVAGFEGLYPGMITGVSADGTMTSGIAFSGSDSGSPRAFRLTFPFFDRY